MTTQELCKRLNISHTTAIRWASEGCPHRRTPKEAFRWEIKTVQAWRDENVRQSSPTFHAIRERKDAAVAARHEIALRKMKGELIDRDTAHKKMFVIVRQVRDGILGIADRVAGIVAAERDPQTCRAILHEEVERILDDLQKNMERFVA